MRIFSQATGRIDRPSTRATVPARPLETVGTFGKVRHEAKGRWAELMLDLFSGTRADGALVTLSSRHSEDPFTLTCATLSLQEAKELRELLDEAIRTATQAEAADHVASLTAAA